MVNLVDDAIFLDDLCKICTLEVYDLDVSNSIGSLL